MPVPPRATMSCPFFGGRPFPDVDTAVAQAAGSTGRRRPGIVCGMDDTTETQLRAAQQKVDLAAAKLARAIVARDRIIKTTVAAGATRYAVAKVTGLTQPAVKKAVDRT